MKIKKIFSVKTYEKLRLAYMILFLFAVLTRVLMPIALNESQLVNSAVFGFVAFFGLLVLAVDFFGERIMFTVKYKELLSLFLATVVASSIINVKYGFLGNIRNFVWLLISFFLLYAINLKREKKDVLKEIGILSNILIAVWFCAVVYSLYMFIFQIGFYVYIYPDSFARQGFIENRLFGIFEDPNFAAMVSIITIVFSIWNIKALKNKILNIFYITNIVLQFCYVVLSGSRTAQLAASIGVFVFSFFAFRYKFFDIKNKAFKHLAIVISSILLSGFAFFAVNLSSELLSYVPPMFSFCSAKGEESTQHKIKPAMTKREDIQDTSDVSSCRFKIWKAAFELFKSKPILGTSPRNMRQYAKTEFPNNFIGMRGYAVHNVYLDILTSTGILGALAIVLFFVKYLVYIFKYLFSKNAVNKSNYLYVTFFLTIIAMIAVSAAFLSEIFFVNTVSVLFFWLSMGKCVYFIENEDNAS